MSEREFGDWPAADAAAAAPGWVAVPRRCAVSHWPNRSPKDGQEGEQEEGRSRGGKAGTEGTEGANERRSDRPRAAAAIRVAGGNESIANAAAPPCRYLLPLHLKARNLSTNPTLLVPKQPYMPPRTSVISTGLPRLPILPTASPLRLAPRRCIFTNPQGNFRSRSNRSAPHFARNTRLLLPSSIALFHADNTAASPSATDTNMAPVPTTNGDSSAHYKVVSILDLASVAIAAIISIRHSD